MVTLLELGGAQQNTLFTVKNLSRSKFEVSLVCGEGAFLDDEAEMAKYNAAIATGCCGVFDEEILIDGRMATIGCNYGH